MTNREKLKNLMVEIFLLKPTEFDFGLSADQIDTWDSLGVVSLTVGIQQTFGYQVTPEEALGLKGVQDVVQLLSLRGIRFED
jgi:acyl carrier protein